MVGYARVFRLSQSFRLTRVLVFVKRRRRRNRTERVTVTHLRPRGGLSKNWNLRSKVPPSPPTGVTISLVLVKYNKQAIARILAEFDEQT